MEENTMERIDHEHVSGLLTEALSYLEDLKFEHNLYGSEFVDALSHVSAAINSMKNMKVI